MSETFRPETPEQLEAAVRWAQDSGLGLEIGGAFTKRAYGRTMDAAHRLDLSAFSGITLYEPEELVLRLGSATSMAEVTAALAEKKQQLAFEPMDMGPLLGAAPGGGTIGGVIGCNLAGPRRIKTGAARDHVLGFRAVSGRGEAFKSGGRVVKNVTGFDLSKLMTGSFGTLAALTEVTLKVLPAPERTRTVLVFGLGDDAAMRAMSQALQSPHEVSAAAHLPAGVAGRSSVELVSGAAGAVAAVTAIRVEGPGPSAEVRCAKLRERLAPFGATEELHSRNSAQFWREVRDVQFFADDSGGGARQVWRISAPPASGAAVAAEILGAVSGEAFYDWGGGLIWLAVDGGTDAGHETVRAALASTGGHATLVRANDATRRAVPVFQPQPAPLAAVTRRTKEAFDPGRALNPGRMYEGV